MTLFNTAGNILFKVGCLKAAASIIVASAGGHKHEWSPYKKQLYSDAVKYSLFNSVGIIVSSLTTTSLIPAALFLSGTAMFCAPAWYKCFTDNNQFQKFMPFGGVCMIAGWVALAFV